VRAWEDGINLGVDAGRRAGGRIYASLGMACTCTNQRTD